jgi:hypothetical protein
MSPMPWNDPLVLATLALVVATGVLAIFAWRSARHAKTSVELLERSQLIESMPMVMPLPAGGVRTGQGTELAVMVRNSGRNAALNGLLRVVIGSHRLELIPFAHLEADGERQIRFPVQDDSFPMWGEADAALTLEYRDAVGNRYRIEHVTTVSGRNHVNVSRHLGGKWEPLLVADGRAEISWVELEVPDPPES